MDASKRLKFEMAWLAMLSRFSDM